MIPYPDVSERQIADVLIDSTIVTTGLDLVSIWPVRIAIAITKVQNWTGGPPADFCPNLSKRILATFAAGRTARDLYAKQET